LPERGPKRRGDVVDDGRELKQTDLSALRQAFSKCSYQKKKKTVLLHMNATLLQRVGTVIIPCRGEEHGTQSHIAVSGGAGVQPWQPGSEHLQL